MITSGPTETLYPEASANESVDSVFDSVGELSTSTHQFFTKLAATRKRIAELPFFDEENYKRLLALESRVKKVLQ